MTFSSVQFSPSSQIILKPIGMISLQQSCTHIKDAFSTWDKKRTSQKVQSFHPCWRNCSNSFTIFFFLTVGPYVGFIYLGMVDKSSCRSQPMGYNKQVNFSYALTFSLLLGSTSNITSVMSYEFHSSVAQGWQYCTKWDENILEKWERVLFTVDTQFTGETNCSRGDD